MQWKNTLSFPLCKSVFDTTKVKCHFLKTGFSLNKIKNILYVEGEKTKSPSRMKIYTNHIILLTKLNETGWTDLNRPSCLRRRTHYYRHYYYYHHHTSYTKQNPLIQCSTDARSSRPPTLNVRQTPLWSNTRSIQVAQLTFGQLSSHRPAR